MHKIQHIIDHIERVYKLELAPCSIPRDQFQYLKRNFYIFVLEKVSKKLFYFLKKISPVRFLDKRPDGEVLFYKRNSEGRLLIEIVIRPVPIEACIYLACDSGFFKPMGENYIVKIYGQHNSVDHISFPLNHHNGIEQVDYYFSKEGELKRELRNYKLNILINV